MNVNSPHLPAGWYPDPTGVAGQRWWDGASWTPHTSPAPSAALVLPPARASFAPVMTAPAAYGAQLPVGVWRTPIDNRPYVRGMTDALRVVWAKYAQFDGRAGRAEYWYFTLLCVLVALGGGILVLVPFVGWLLYFAVMMAALAVLIPSISVLVRRMRDAGFSWLWLLLMLIPGGSIVLLIFTCMPSKYP